jgi:glucan phosphoethanolaminetransferase (alkaline phosphatase superfamily)
MITLYKNAVSWSVDGFFRKVLTAADLAGVLIIYTSDHGQSLLDNGYKMSHCSSPGNIAKGEGLVPLFSITLDPGWMSRLDEAAKQGKNRSSHFEIFATLLIALGYQEEGTRAKYGPSLMDAPPQRVRRFLAGHPPLWSSAE